MSKVLAAAALLVVAITGCLAAEKKAKPADLREKIAGRTVIINTSIGDIPVVYHPNGAISGKLTTMQAMATGPKVDKGQWWVDGDRLCQKWRNWLRGERHCFRLQFSGKTIHWASDTGTKGTARLASY
ncbi:MAG: hypothetical protein ACK5JT_17705 [Hyphomicrobiaceae bacterium]